MLGNPLDPIERARDSAKTSWEKPAKKRRINGIILDIITGTTLGYPPRAFGFLSDSVLKKSYLIEAQQRAQYRGGFAFVRQVECAHKKEAGGQLLGSGGPGFGSSIFSNGKTVWCGRL